MADCKTSREREQFRYKICAHIVPGVKVDSETGVPSALWQNKSAFKPRRWHLLREIIRRDPSRRPTAWTTLKKIQYLLDTPPPESENRSEVEQRPSPSKPGDTTEDGFERKQAPNQPSSPPEVENEEVNESGIVADQEREKWAANEKGGECQNKDAEAEPMAPMRPSSSVNDAHSSVTTTSTPTNAVESSQNTPKLRWKHRDTIRLVNVLVYLRDDFIQCQRTSSLSQTNSSRKIKETASFWEKAAQMFNDDDAEVYVFVGDEFEIMDSTWTLYEASPTRLREKFEDLRKSLNAVFARFTRSDDNGDDENLLQEGFTEEVEEEIRKVEEEARVESYYENRCPEFRSAFNGKEDLRYYLYAAAVKFRFIRYIVRNAKHGGANGEVERMANSVVKPLPQRAEAAGASVATVNRVLDAVTEKSTESRDFLYLNLEAWQRYYASVKKHHERDFKKRNQALEDENQRREREFEERKKALEDERQRHEREFKERKQALQVEEQRCDRDLEKLKQGLKDESRRCEEEKRRLSAKRKSDHEYPAKESRYKTPIG